MKRLLMITLALTMALCISACGKQEKQPDSLGSSNVQMANPFAECENLDDAAQIAGFSMSVPDAVPDWVNETHIRAVENDMIEVIYTGTEQQELRIRKAEGNEDISGVFDSFDEVKNIIIENRDVTLKINDGKIFVAAWTDGDCSYAVTTAEGLEQAQIENLISSIS